MTNHDKKHNESKTKARNEDHPHSEIREGQSNSAIEKNHLIKNNPYPGLSVKDLQNKNQEEFETTPASIPKKDAE